jgi:hypothetical protein
MKAFVILLVVKLMVLWPGQQPDSCAGTKQARNAPPKVKVQVKSAKAAAATDRNWLLYRIPLSI